MPRIIVTTETSDRTDRRLVLLDERVQSVHLSTGHAATQLIERLAWAISDAEDSEDSLPRRAEPSERQTPIRKPAPAQGARRQLAA
ncbi:MAG: hypothetical protein ABSG95_09895 [Solirubrobacteraceae bacterium]|jgi:hypothetical protein